MYISCYDSDETDFTHAGRFKVNVTEDENNIYRAVNGQFYVTFKVFIEEPFINYLQPRCIVKIPTPNKKNPYQLFRITDFDDDDIGITFTAFHIAWDLSTGFLPDINIVGKNRAEACTYILDKAKESKPHRFKIVAKDINTEQKTLQIVRYNPLVALMGDKDNTVLNRYENIEFDFNNFDIEIYNRLGVDTNFVIKDNKNINTSNRNLDYKPIATRIVPQGADELLLPEYYIDSPKISYYDEIFYKHVVFNEIRVDEENGITKEMALDLLRQASLKMFSDAHIDEPFLSLNINFDDRQDDLDIPVELRDLMRLDIGDTVTVVKKRLGKIETRILEYNYNFVKAKYRDITISSLAKNFTISLDKTVSNLVFKVDSFVSKVSNITGDIYTKIEQTEKGIRIDLANGLEDLEGLINLTAEGLETKFTDKDKELETQIIINTEGVKSKVSSGEGFTTEFNQNAESFNFGLGNGNTNVNINKDEMVIKNGKLKVKNNNGTDVLYADQNGNLINTGIFQQYSLKTGKKSVSIEDNNMKFFDWERDGDLVGAIYTGSDPKQNFGSMVVKSDDGNPLLLTCGNTSDRPLIVLSDNNSQPTKIAIWEDITHYDKFKSKGGIYINDYQQIELFGNDSTIPLAQLFVSGGSNDTWLVANSNHGDLILGDRLTSGTYTAIMKVARGGVTVLDNFAVTGTKNCIQKTQNYGNRLFYSVEDGQSFLTETSESNFTVEVNPTNGSFERCILINTIFKECVDLSRHYIIEINKVSWGDYKIKEQTPDGFILEADREDFVFNYCIKAKRKGYENVSLEEYINIESEVMTNETNIN